MQAMCVLQHRAVWLCAKKGQLWLFVAEPAVGVQQGC
jgi:hypothetical protein